MAYSSLNIELARRLLAAFIATRMGIAPAQALARHVPSVPSTFWLEMARMLNDDYDATIATLLSLPDPAPADPKAILMLPLRSGRPS